MDDILVRIDRSSVSEESCDLVCRLIDCKGEIERLRASADAARTLKYTLQIAYIALCHHTEQTRPIENTNRVIDAIAAALKSSEMRLTTTEGAVRCSNLCGHTANS